MKLRAFLKALARKSASIIVILLFALILCTVPPFSVILQRAVQRVWLPSQFVRVVSLMSGAQESIVVTESCRLGILDAVYAANEQVRRGLSSFGDEESLVIQWFRRLVSSRQGDSSSVSCAASASVVASVIRDANTASTADVDSVRILLAALDDLGLVDCVEEGRQHDLDGGCCFTTTPMAERFLVRQTAGVDYLCGMGVAANHPALLRRLASLDDVLFGRGPSDERRASRGTDADVLQTATKKTMLSVVRRHEDDTVAQDADVWRRFAAETAAFSHGLAAKVARAVALRIDDVVAKDTLDNQDAAAAAPPPLRFVDVGCGSGAYLRALMDHYHRTAGGARFRSSFVYVDLDDVLQETRKLHLAYLAERPGVRSPQTTFVPASILEPSPLFDAVLPLARESLLHSDTATVAAEVGELRVVLVNSVLQHFGSDIVRGVLANVSEAMRQDCDSAATRVCGVVVVTEMVLPRGGHEARGALLRYLHEPLPMTGVFSMVLRSITEQRGEVRSECAYVRLAEQAGLVWVRTEHLFPMPAVVMFFDVLPRGRDSAAGTPGR